MNVALYILQERSAEEKNSLYIAPGVPEEAVARFRKWVPAVQEEDDLPGPHAIRLLDLPCTDEYRMVLFSIATPHGNTVDAGILLKRQDSADMLCSCENFYSWIFHASENGFGEALLNHRTPTVNLTPETGRSIQTNLGELFGWQMIGDPEKGVRTLARMLAGTPVDDWFEHYFLAVNPKRYSDAYTSIVSCIPPEGSWKYTACSHSRNGDSGETRKEDKKNHGNAAESENHFSASVGGGRLVYGENEMRTLLRTKKREIRISAIFCLVIIGLIALSA